MEIVMCDCRKRLEASIKENTQANLAEDCTDLSVSLDGYAIIFGNGSASSHQFMRAEITYQKPTKAGVLKQKKESVNMLAKFCMFCGEKYPEAA
jgi:hypothetical protein